MHSWATILITAAVCYTVLVTSCYRSYKSSRMRPLMWWREPGGSINITPVLHKLHWLPVCQRIRFKLAMTVYKYLSGLAPAYLADDCVLVSSVASRLHLRSADARKLVVHKRGTVLNARDFAVSSTVVWNSLPAELHRWLLQHLSGTWKLTCSGAWTNASEDFCFALYKCAHYSFTAKWSLFS